MFGRSLLGMKNHHNLSIDIVMPLIIKLHTENLTLGIKGVKALVYKATWYK